MVEIDNTLLIAQFNNLHLGFYLISGRKNNQGVSKPFLKVSNDQSVTWGHYIGFQHYKGIPNSTEPVIVYSTKQPIKSRDSFSFSSNGQVAYIFGGKKSTQTFDELYHIRTSLIKKELRIHVDLVPQENVANWPMKRFGHAAEIIYQKLYIFGGQDGQQFFSDLHVYDVDESIWTEIKYQGYPTPVSHASSIYLSNINCMLVYGGLTNDGVVEDCLMKFDFKQNEWILMKVLGQNPNQKLSNYELQLPFHSANAHVIKNQMYMIGGSNEEKNLNHILCLNDVNEIGRSFMLPKYLNDKRLENFLCDYSIKVFNEETQKFDEISVHKFVIAARSPNLLSFENFKEFNFDTISAYVQFLYTGCLDLVSTKNIQKLCELTHELEENEEIIKKICYSNVYLSDVQNISVEMELNFGDLLDNEETSDLTLILDQNMKIHVHKIILCRSPYFNKMFTSGMIESSMKEIELLECDKASTLEVLHYLYTDSIELNHENCVGILIVSLLLQIVEISDFCRSIVSNHLNLQNIYQILNIADLYHDVSLKRICFNFLKKNISEVEFLDEYLELDEKLKSELDQVLSEHKKKMTKKAKIKK